MAVNAKVKVTSLLLIALMLSINGCKKSGPVEPSITRIDANATVVVRSRTEVAGTLFVTDQDGNPVGNLSSSNVTARLVWMSKSMGEVVGTVTIRPNSSTGKSMAVALTMDYSGSMFSGSLDSTGRYQRIAGMENAAKTFIGNMSTSDIAEIIKFGSSVSVVQPFTSDKSALQTAIVTNSFNRGSTALYQSIYQGLMDASRQDTSRYLRLVISFTDGGENSSYVSLWDVVAASVSNAIPVFTVGLLDSVYHTTPPGQGPCGDYGCEPDLVFIADTTGGFYYYASSPAVIAQLYDQINRVLRSSSYSFSVQWPSSGLPPSGTSVTMILGISVGNVSTEVRKTYRIP